MEITVRIVPAVGDKLTFKLRLPPSWQQKPSAKLKPFFAKQFAARGIDGRRSSQPTDGEALDSMARMDIINCSCRGNGHGVTG